MSLKSDIIIKTLESKSDLTLSLVLFCVSCVLFFWNIGNPAEIYNDEIHYVPAARYFLGLAPLVNIEHPPLAKLFIALGMRLFGDTPVGWRFFSVIMGALIVPLFYLISRRIGWNRAWSLWMCVLLLANQMLFVQARIATLDIYFVFFSVLAIFCFLNSETKRDHVLTSLALGFAMACKWSAFPLILLAVFAMLFFRKNSLRFLPQMAVSFSAAYVMPFLPYVWKGDWSWSDVVMKQFEALALQQQVGTRQHGYMSAWWEWPFMNKPTWYAFDQMDNHFEGIISLGNPFLYWTGFAATALLTFHYFLASGRRTYSLSVALILFWGNYLFWVLTARKLTFFYYYFLPSLFFPWIMAEAMRGVSRVAYRTRVYAVMYLCVTVAVFMYFYPVLAHVREPLSRLGHWAWFRGWI